MLEAIQSYESRFNQRHHYDWTFLSDRALSLQSKELATQLRSGKVTFNTINGTEWAFPQAIDSDKAYGWRIMMKELGLERGNTIDERHKSRFLSRFFFNNEALSEYDYNLLLETEPRAD
jgi:mannosyltransferase